jgi:uncharacterized protein (TIGR00369 family)
MQAAAMTAEELTRALSVEFPQLFAPNARDSVYVIEHVQHGNGRVRRRYREAALRPGGTLSGATMMELADVAMYVAVLASIGWVPLAVTTNLNINFLRKPGQRDLVADARLIKLGKRLAVGDVNIRSDGTEAIVAHATSTYSIPQGGER